MVAWLLANFHLFRPSNKSMCEVSFPSKVQATVSQPAKIKHTHTYNNLLSGFDSSGRGGGRSAAAVMCVWGWNSCWQAFQGSLCLHNAKAFNIDDKRKNVPARYTYFPAWWKYTVEPRFNEVPRDWGNLFVISRVHYIENHDITNLWENNECARCIGV